MNRIALIAATALAVLPASGNIAVADKFYEGKSVDFIIGGNAGAGYDAYARMLMRHMGRHIPGSPTFVARNMPGAGGSIAAAWLANVAPRDGSTLGAIYPGSIMNPLLQPDRKFTYDPVKFAYLGSADSTVSVCATYHTSPVKTYEDARRIDAIIGGSPGSPAEYAFLHQRAGNLKIKIVPGYKGTTDIFLAMERGEVAGFCGVSWSSINAQRPDWIRDGKFNFIAHDSVDPDPELTKLGAPHSLGLIKDPRERAAAELIFSQQVFGRPYVAPPGTPENRVALLRSAFTATMKDEAFLADAKKARLIIEPTSGARMEELIRRAYSAPKDVVARATQLIAQ